RRRARRRASDAWTGSSVLFERARREGPREKLLQRPASVPPFACEAENGHLRSELLQKLSAHAARRSRLVGFGGDQNGGERPDAARHGGGHGAPLGAYTGRKRGILH